MNQVLTLLVPASMAAALACLLTPLSERLAKRVGAMDMPGPRRVHGYPVPRLGGLAVVVSTVAVLGAGALGVPGAPRWATSASATGIALGLIPILVVSVWDDIRSAKALTRLVAHGLGAGIAISYGVVLTQTVHLFGHPLPLGWLAIPLSVIWLVGVTNAFNLVDGLDGLSGGLALISAASLAAMLLLAHRPDTAAAALVLAGAIMGFLPFNLHPARVFLGDSGATAIGYLLGCLTLTSSTLLSAGFATLLPVMLISIPVADTVVSIFRRAVSRLESGRGNRVYEADANHIHHRLLKLGLSHQRAVLLLWGVGGGLSLVALASMLLTNQQAGLLLVSIVLAVGIGLNRLGYAELALVRRGVALRVYDLPVMRRTFFVVFVDIFLVALALYLATALKSDAWLLAGRRAQVFSALALLVPSHVVLFAVFGVYKGSWRLAGVYDFLRLNLAIIAASFLAFALSVALSVPDLSLALFVIFTFIASTVTTASRVSYRILDHAHRRGTRTGTAAIVYGAGKGGAAAVREMRSNTDVGLTPVGFIDDHPERAGKTVDGYPVLGTIEKLEEALARTGARVVVVSSPTIPEARVRMAQDTCERAGSKLLRMQIGFHEVAGSGPAVRAEDRDSRQAVPSTLAGGEAAANTRVRRSDEGTVGSTIAT